MRRYIKSRRMVAIEWGIPFKGGILMGKDRSHTPYKEKGIYLYLLIIFMPVLSGGKQNDEIFDS